MSTTTRMMQALAATVLAASLFGCDEKPEEKAPATASAPVVETAPPVTASAAPAETAPKPSHACPEGSTGEGTFKSPCDATGTARVMDVKWTGKMSEKGPYFQVINKTDIEILYGQLVVFFYDKAGKLLEVPESDGSKARPKQVCVGNIFAGPMKPGEKAVLQFSCVKKSHVPEGTVFVEAEIQKVGFTGSDGRKADTYWRNKDLAPDDRPKGGIKKK